MDSFSTAIVVIDYYKYDFDAIRELFPEFKSSRDFNYFDQCFCIDLMWKPEYIEIFTKNADKIFKKASSCNQHNFYFNVETCPYLFKLAMNSFNLRFKHIDNSYKYDLASVLSSCKRQLEEFNQKVYWYQLYKFYGCKRKKALKLSELAAQTIQENNIENPFKHLGSTVEKDVSARFIHAIVFLKHDNKYQESNLNWEAFSEMENTRAISTEYVKNNYEYIFIEPDFALHVVKIKPSFINTVNLNYFLNTELEEKDILCINLAEIVILNKHDFVYNKINEFLNINYIYHLN